MTLKKRRIIMVSCIVLVIVITPVVLMYTLGYRLNSKFEIVKTGGLQISSPIRGSQVYVNKKEVLKTNILQDSILIQSLTPKTYSILVAKDGYWPWQKDLEVNEKLVTETRAFLVPKDPVGEFVKKEDIKEEEIINELNKFSVAPKKFKNDTEKDEYYNRYTKNEKQHLWWNPANNNIYVEWTQEDSIPYYFCSMEECGALITVLDSIYTIRNVEFYPGRDDMIIMALQNGVFAIEIDGRGTRNMQPLYKGKKPTFITQKNESFIYVLDDGSIIKLQLE